MSDAGLENRGGRSHLMEGEETGQMPNDQMVSKAGELVAAQVRLLLKIPFVSRVIKQAIRAVINALSENGLKYTDVQKVAQWAWDTLVEEGLIPKEVTTQSSSPSPSP